MNVGWATRLVPITIRRHIEMFKMVAFDLFSKTIKHLPHSSIYYCNIQTVRFSYLLQAMTNSSVKTGEVNPKTMKSLKGIRVTAT